MRGFVLFCWRMDLSAVHIFYGRKENGDFYF